MVRTSPSSAGGVGLILVVHTVKNLPPVQETYIQYLSWEDAQEKGMATHYSILAYRIPQTEEPGNL